jgi:hypothetical protein
VPLACIQGIGIAGRFRGFQFYTGYSEDMSAKSDIEHNLFIQISEKILKYSPIKIKITV